MIGIRPHDLIPAMQGSLAQVAVTEITGESTLLHLTWHGHTLHMQVTGRHAAGSGDPLTIALRMEKIHLFDAQSGQRLPEAPPLP